CDKSGASDCAFAAGPIRLAQLAFVEFSRGIARELGQKVDRAWQLILRELARTELQQLVGERSRRRRASARLDDGFDFLTPFFIRYAKNGYVAHGRMANQHAFHFGRVDVDAARDDHVRLAVAKEEIAVLIEVTDIADGRIFP